METGKDNSEKGGNSKHHVHPLINEAIETALGLLMDAKGREGESTKHTMIAK